MPSPTNCRSKSVVFPIFQSRVNMLKTLLRVDTFVQDLSIPNPDKGFLGCDLETIAGLKVALGLERVDLVGGNGRDDVNEGIDDGSMLGQIEGRELFDMADVGHVPGIQQGFIV